MNVLIELESKMTENDDLSQDIKTLMVKLDVLTKQHEQELRQKNSKMQDQSKELERVYAELENFKAISETVEIKTAVNKHIHHSMNLVNFR